MVEVVWLATPLVVMVKVALRAPPAMVTFACTLAATVLLLVSVITAPPAAAAPLSVTVPVALLPPTTELGVLVTEDNAAGLTVSVVVLVTPA